MSLVSEAISMSLVYEAMSIPLGDFIEEPGLEGSDIVRNQREDEGDFKGKTLPGEKG
jgi:hypothetical protein